MKDYKKLNVFQKTRQFNSQLYTATKNFPESEKYGITSQIRRASVSIATNIAEGCGREGSKEFAHFLQIAYASACEVECLLILSEDQQFLPQRNIQELASVVEEIKKMLFAFISKLKTED